MDRPTVAIIGGGPAGIAAAIQLKRYGIDPVIFEKGQPGGLLNNAGLVENYPGFPEGITGPELAKKMLHHLQKSGSKICLENVLDLDWENGRFTVRTDSRELAADFAVVASGTKPVRIEASLISERSSDRIYYEVYPLLGIEGKKVVIIGAGDAAFDYALNLSRKNEVTILNRTDSVSCLPLLFERSRAVQSIRYYEFSQIRNVETIKNSLQIQCYCDKTEEPFTIESDYLIGAIGRSPRMNFLNRRLQKQVDILTADERLYFAGDVINDNYRQTAICAGDGIKTAMKIWNEMGK